MRHAGMSSQSSSHGNVFQNHDLETGVEHKHGTLALSAEPKGRRSKTKVQSQPRSDSTERFRQLVRQSIRYEDGKHIGDESQSSGSDAQVLGADYEENLRQLFEADKLTIFLPPNPNKQLFANVLKEVQDDAGRLGWSRPQDKSLANGFESFDVDAFFRFEHLQNKMNSPYGEFITLCYPRALPSPRPASDTPIIAEATTNSKQILTKLLQLEMIMMSLEMGGSVKPAKYNQIDLKLVICAVICNRKKLEVSTMRAILKHLPHMTLLSNEGRLLIIDIPTSFGKFLELPKALERIQVERELERGQAASQLQQLQLERDLAVQQASERIQVERELERAVQQALQLQVERDLAAQQAASQLQQLRLERDLAVQQATRLQGQLAKLQTEERPAQATSES